jgi:trehalose 6-phosphate synthase
MGGSLLARLILVSNRVPAGGEARAGGLEVALASSLKRKTGVWFGWSGNVVEGEPVGTRATQRAGITYVVTDLSEENHQEYYNGFANRVLWPILHYRLDLAEFERRELSGYFRVNQHFAGELSKFLSPDDIVWVHDYHLIPIASELRRRGHSNRIGFFLHVPFPAAEIMTALPNHEQLIPLLLKYDMVGFQTESDVTNFMRYIIKEYRHRDSPRVFEAVDHQLVFTQGGQRTGIGSFPVGIDTQDFARLARRAAQSTFVRELVTNLGDQALIIGVDRLDYSKGLIERFEAFDRFFAGRPEWRRKVTYLQITPKSRSEIQEYRELGESLGAAEGRINGKYGEVTWTPIRYVNKVHSRYALAGLYRSARVGMVTPLRDGMNLVAKEFVAAQNPHDPGVLILSRFAGAANECEHALLVNPYDSESVAAAIARALEMPLGERRDRHQLNLEVLSQNDTHPWAARFLESLEATQSLSYEGIEPATSLRHAPA